MLSKDLKMERPAQARHYRLNGQMIILFSIGAAMILVKIVVQGEVGKVITRSTSIHLVL